MRNNVTFNYPEIFVPVSAEDGGILSVEGARWFVSLLRRIPGLQVDEEPCQEDWGVVFFTARNDKSFWIGISSWDDHVWLVHVHHGSFAWRQRWSRSGKNELDELIESLHRVLVADPKATEIEWYREEDVGRADSRGSSAPFGD